MESKVDPQQVLWKLLEENKRPMAGDELSEMSKIRLSRVRSTLGKMVKERIVRRAGGGKFCLVSKHSHR